MTKKSVDLLKSIWLLVKKVFLMTNKLLKLVTIILIKQSLTLLCDPEHLNDVSDENDPIKIAMKTFKDHPSIVNINKNIPKTETFTFNETEADLIKKLIILMQGKVKYLEQSQPIALKVFHIFLLIFSILSGMMKYSKI